jgi:3-hydroxyacyl-CoA dehydrogenase
VGGVGRSHRRRVFPLQHRPPGRLDLGASGLKRGNVITEHDFTVASQIAYVLAGGDLSQPAEMPLSYFYQLEIQVVGYLAQQPKTWERMRHMLETGKPLRN